MKKVLITTPIYYANAALHVGHAYSTFIADVYARYKRMLGYQVKFSTGTDENSQKIVQKAQEAGIDVMKFLDDMSADHRKLWDDLDITYTDFIRTTEERHKIFVQKILQKTYEHGDIYQGEYEGLYCIGCESFKKESDLIKNEKGELVCPDHLKKPEVIKEKNRFFKLSSYESKLKEFYTNHADFVMPPHRFNEIKAFVDGGLEDFSISRQSNTFGIPLPFDPEQVTYVWYDALLNYVTVCQHQEPNFWSEDTEIIHVMGKDITRFHAIYRPAMLMAADLPLPTREIVTGYFTLDGQKISKSLGNAIDPKELINQYSRDALVFYMLYDISIGSDGDFSMERFAGTYNSILIGGRGNLISRVTKLAEKYGITQGKYDSDRAQSHEINTLLEQLTNIENYLSETSIQIFLLTWYKTVQAANTFMQHEQPREKYKNGNELEGQKDLEFLLWVIKQCAVITAPILVE